MTIDKVALFESTKLLWPSLIDLSANPNALNEIYWANEKANSVDDDWRQIAMWSFHQALSEFAKEAQAEGASKLSPQAISLDAFDRWMRSNLWGDDGWLWERMAWENSPLSPQPKVSH
jgi:hypothetical protein